jgi:transcriptional regulator with XRE-family HTH domain
MFSQMESLGDRLDIALFHANPRMNMTKLSKKLGKTIAWLSGVKIGRWRSEEKLREAAKILGVPEDWLIHGTGPAPTWAPKPPPEHESLQKSMDLLLKMFSEQQAEIKALRQEVQILTAKKSSDTQSMKRPKIPLDLPESIPASAP